MFMLMSKEVNSKTKNQKNHHMDQTAKQQVAEKLRDANNVLITVSKNPSVDEMSAAIGLNLMLNKLGKHSTTVFSGKVPDAISFLEPGKTVENNIDSLRDFIISLDKDKADKLRYKVEDEVVKIFITPYKTKITNKDLEFSQGDFNVDVIVGLGVVEKSDLDQAIMAHGRILHDASIVTINPKDKDGKLGEVNWADENASSISEMLVSISEALEGGILDEEMSTAFLTGIVSVTDRFSNEKTTPKLMTMAAQLMAAGADQQLIANNLNMPIKSKAPKKDTGKIHNPNEAIIEHDKKVPKQATEDVSKALDSLEQKLQKSSDKEEKSVDTEKSLIKYMTYFELPRVNYSGYKKEIKKLSVDIFEDFKTNRSKYKFTLKPVHVLSFAVIFAVLAAALGYFGFYGRPLNPKLVLNKSITYYSQIDDDKPNQYYFIQTMFTQNNAEESITRYNKLWDDMDSSNYVAETVDESGEVLNKVIRIDDALYFSDEDFIDQKLDEEIVETYEITTQDLDTLSYKQIDEKLIENDQPPYFKEFYGTEDFPGYTMHPDKVLTLSEEEFQEAFPSKLIPTDIEIKEEQNYFRISEELMQTQDINQRLSLLNELRQLTYLELTEEKQFNGQDVIGINFQNKLISESDQITSYFSLDDFRYVGSEAKSIKSGGDNVTAKTLVTDEYYIEETPSLNTTGMTKQEYDGFNSDNLSGEVASYTNDRLGITFDYPVEWGTLVEQPQYFDERADDFIVLEPSFYINISIDATSEFGAGYQSEVPEGSLGYEKRGQWFFDRADPDLRLDEFGVAQEKQNLYQTKYLQVKYDKDVIEIPDNQSIQTVSVNLENSAEFDGFSISYWGSDDATDLEILLSTLRTDIDQR